jgi:hypothetical protein
MRKYIDILSESSRLAEPSKTALKFWITDKGKVEMMDGEHHYDYVADRGMHWGQPFDKGWIRGFVETKSDLICFDFDQRKVANATRRAMLKLIKEFASTTVIWDDTRGGAFYGSERLPAQSFIQDLRHMVAEDESEIDETEILDEMPMQAVTHLGDWTKNSGYNSQDRKLLNNPKAIKKIQAAWKFPEEVDYNVVLVNNPEANRHMEVGLVGDQNSAQDWLVKNMPKNAPDIIAALRGDQVNIIYTNNKGAERVPMTGWIMAHRFGHAIFARQYGKQSSHYYDESAQTLARYLDDLAKQYGISSDDGVGRGDRNLKALLSASTRNLMTAICTFKSARDGNLRNTFEALHELLSQYIFTGKLTFADIPKSVKVGR